VASELPVGTVTFLLTDVEGSSREWERDEDAMQGAIARHDALIAEAVASHGGVLPKERGEGDAWLAVFSRATDAVAAALDAQRALASEPHRVRMAVCTGEAELRDGDYYGLALSRCARVRELAHGGQVLLARTTHDLVSHRPPDGAALRDLGPHRLRDLGRPEHVFQLCHADIDDGFPPLCSLDSRPNNLPAQLTTFIGREHEMIAVGKLLAANRLVTVTGSGGCGKTRLALQVAADLLDDYPDGVWWVDLGPVGDPDLVPSAVGRALGIREVSHETCTATLERIVATKRVLVVLDNCEHVLDACAELSHSLLCACTQLVLVATSREPLGVDGETTWRVPSLTMPSEAEPLPNYEATRLFIDRASRARPSFEVSGDNADVIAQICRRLDGIPLAIELAAARIRVMTPEQIAAGLDDRFRLLAGGTRTAMPRQRTLEASVDWSFTLLTEEQRILFRRLSVFAGSFALDSAEAVCAGEGLGAHQVFDVLLQLIDRSLVQIEGDGPRYRLLETIRQYGRQKLVDAGEADVVRLRHLDHYTALVERARPLIEAGGTIHWLDRMHRELENVRAALDCALSSGNAGRGLLLATAWPEYWGHCGTLTEGRSRIDALLEAADPDPRLYARAVVALLVLARRQGTDLRSALSHGDRAIALVRDIGEHQLEARLLVHVGAVKTLLGDDEALLLDAVAAARAAGDAFGAHNAMNHLGLRRLRIGDIAGARAITEESVTDTRTTGDLIGFRQAIFVLACCSIVQGRPADAERELGEALDIAGSLRDPNFDPQLRGMLGLVACMRGNDEVARALIDEALQEARETENPLALGNALQGLALAERSAGNADAAAAAAEEGAAANSAVAQHGIQSSTCSAVGAWAALQRGALERADALLDEALTQAEGIPYLVAIALDVKALLARERGDLLAAADIARTAVAQGPDTFAAADAFETLAGALALQGDREEASRLFGAGATLRQRTGFVRWASAEDGYRAQVAIVRDALGDDAFTKAWDEGAALSTEDAIAYATRGRGARRRPSAGWNSLTPTELEVVRLVAEGLTNPQIGERLFVRRGTVKTHLAHVFAKLGVATRSELATEATRRGV
jgi:predicted ATPase/class 3 adenylate cyclase/DNA-binding CsgD family transcriptional regulator